MKDAQMPDIKPTAGYLKKSDRILIVGGTGFIGRHVAKRCLEDTRFVACLGLSKRDGSASAVQNIESINVDLTDRQKVQAVISKRQFDYVLNLGGYIDHTPYFKGGRRSIDSHFNGLLNLIDSLDRKSLKGFVQIGSSDEYGNKPAPMHEGMREDSISPYSLAKTAASHFIEMLARTEGFPGVVLRFFLVYGPGQDRKRFLPQIINGCLRDEEFKTSEGKQLRDFCYIDDVVDALMRAAATQEALGRIINIASGRPVSIKDVILQVMAITGGGKPVWGAHPYRKGENMSLYADVRLAKSLLGWEPSTSLDEGLRKTIEYYNQLDKYGGQGDTRR